MKRIDVVGQRFGRLVVIRYVGSDFGSKKRARWLCHCDCGGESVVVGTNLRRGHTTSCGCQIVDTRVAGNKARMTHGHTQRRGTKGRTSTYATWQSMKDRCLNTNSDKYIEYGARGITVCKRWQSSFENFLADMGERPDGQTIDRMNNSKGYAPSNCRWASPKQQANNRRPRRRN